MTVQLKCACPRWSAKTGCCEGTKTSEHFRNDQVIRNYKRPTLTPNGGLQKAITSCGGKYRHEVIRNQEFPKTRRLEDPEEKATFKTRKKKKLVD